jgi:hypothetical protein
MKSEVDSGLYNHANREINPILQIFFKAAAAVLGEWLDPTNLERETASELAAGTANRTLCRVESGRWRSVEPVG